MRRRGFTLLELIIVIVILGVLATLGFAQYGRMVERSRGAEARAVLGSIRTAAAAYRLEYGSLGAVTAAQLNVGTAGNQAPSTCRASHYFAYGISGAGDVMTTTATRCAASGRAPQGVATDTLILTSDFGTGVDTWSGTGGY